MFLAFKSFCEEISISREELVRVDVPSLVSPVVPGPWTGSWDGSRIFILKKGSGMWNKW